MSDSGDDRTYDALVTGALTTPVAATTAPNPAVDKAGPRRFAPGAIIAGRYRLVALLGRGGMGEVYRADDLTLDQPVALKFLPAGVAAGDASLSRFHNELRVARQVSHKNVCRLYDLGDADGHRFLTMEYVDGEDLASLLRRIGRIPQDKAVQIARQLCAGVAAAHERGVLHRDLKPANVMIDGEGDVRITDFGIATAAADTAQELIGTPQYMAPEQFTGQPASIATDVYALGLTLYELFTGRRAFDGKTPVDPNRHEAGAVTTPTSIVRDLDPVIERAILRCLDLDPVKRPQSALAVAAMLPGGDALADALAAGETPSPELLAAAAETEALSVWRAVAAAGTALVGMLLVAGASSDISIVGRTPLEKAPSVLADRAQEIVKSLGYDEAPRDTASRFVLAEDYLDWIRSSSADPDRWSVLARGLPSAVQFWQRTSPADLRPLDARVSITDPPFTQPNMRLVVLDAAGRLQRFRSVPPQRDDGGRAAQGGSAEASPKADVSWSVLFDAAGLDKAAFAPVPPEWAPSDFADTRVAWQGSVPGRRDIPLRVEAASLGGAPVSFAVVGPWTAALPTESQGVDVSTKFVNLTFLSVLVALVGSSFVLARRNIRAGRADRHGADRLAVVLALPLLVAWTIRAEHAWSADIEINLLAYGLSQIGLVVALMWATYLALEPYVRKLWPHLLLGWSRLLSGHVRDPRVGTDVLIGVIFGVVLFANDVARATMLQPFGWAAPFPLFGRRLDVLSSSGSLFGAWVDFGRSSVQGALLCVLLIVLLRLVLRRNWLALPVATLLISSTGLTYMSGSGPWLTLFPLISGALTVLVAVRFGLLALVVARIVWNFLYGVPLTFDFSHWSATPSNWTLTLLAGLIVFAFYASRAGQPLFGKVLRD